MTFYLNIDFGRLLVLLALRGQLLLDSRRRHSRLWLCRPRPSLRPSVEGRRYVSEARGMREASPASRNGTGSRRRAATVRLSLSLSHPSAPSDRRGRHLS